MAVVESDAASRAVSELCGTEGSGVHQRASMDRHTHPAIEKK